MNNIDEPDMIDDVDASYEKNADGSYLVTVKVYDQNGAPVEGVDVILTGYGAYQCQTTTVEKSVPTGMYTIGNTSYSLDYIQRNNLMQYATPEMKIQTTTEVQKLGTPHGTTDANGTAVITISFENLKTYGTLNVEVSKTGFTGMNTTMKVFA